MYHKLHYSCLTLAALIAFSKPEIGYGQESLAGRNMDDPTSEIIVTARYQSEDLSDAALPVSVLDGQAVLMNGVTTLDRLGERFPALTIQPNSTGNLLFVRGVGNFTLLPNSDPAVGWNYDGVFVARPIGTNGNLFDLERIELLKGPQGVLYGRNASAGTIRLIPRRPIAGENSAFMTASLGNFDSHSAEAAVNLALGNDGAVRIAASHIGQDNFLKGYAKGPSQQGLRFQLSANLTPDVSIRLASDYTHLGSIGLGTRYVGNYIFEPGNGRYRFIPSGLKTSSGIYSDEGQNFRETIFLPSAGRGLDQISWRPKQDSHFFGANAELVADLGFASLTLLPAWRRSDINAVVPGAPFGFRQIETDEQFSAEARLAGSNKHVDWLAGLFVFDDEIYLTNPNTFSSSHSFSNQAYQTRSRAIFGNVMFNLNSDIRLGGGVRYTRDRKRFESITTTFAIICQRRINNIPSCPNVPLFQLYEKEAEIPFGTPAKGSSPVPIFVNGVSSGAVVSRSDRTSEGRLTDTATTWRLSAEADIGTNILVYASMETGYRPGGFNSATGFETYRPERLDAFTLGSRQRWLNKRLSFDLELFWWNYKNQQASSVQPDLSTPPRNVNITRNIGGSRMRGVEAEFGWQATPTTKLQASVQYLDAEYRSFEYVQANTGIPPLTGCPFALNPATNLYTVDCSSKRPYNTPRWSIGLGGSQMFDLGVVRMTAVANSSYRSRQVIGFSFLPEQQVASYWTSNAQLILTDKAERLELAAFVRNIEGNRVPNFVIFHPTSNAVVASTISPRVFGLRFGARF